ncbi:MAG: hypothetical protein CSB47_11570 [Proteobacteria bacterium]|nr:MAG: hypothetical protein CSB47_11570 [Pseudomonadota bacterium]
MGNPHYQLKDYDFVKLSRQSKDPKEKRRLLILANLQDGKTQSAVADSLKISVPTFKRTLRRFIYFRSSLSGDGAGGGFGSSLHQLRCDGGSCERHC